MGVNYCSISGCRTRYGRNRDFPNKSHIALFSQPKNEAELYRWCQAVQRTDKKMKIGDKVCELHFAEDSLIRYFETLLPDGTVWRIKRTKLGIKSGAVPTIFPDSKNVSRKRKSENSIKAKNKKIINKNHESQQSTLNKDHEHSDSAVIINNKSSVCVEVGENKNSEHPIMTIKNDPKTAEIVENSEHLIMARNNNVPENAQIVKNESSENPAITYDIPEKVKTIENENSELPEIILNETNKAFTYSTLVNNLKLVIRPDWLWGISVHDEFIMCAKWNKDSTLMKRVIINCNLSIQVFLKNRAIDFNSVKISSIQDLTSILNEVDRCRACVNVDNKEKAECDGYILPKMQSVQCEYCRLVGDREVNKKHNMYWISKGRNFAKHQKLYEKIDMLNKKNDLLKEQLSKIIKIKAVWKMSNQANLNPVED